ncbi:hypothetical protein V6N13_115821 [Hibiscus sabdariffa]|uniref:Uncharacterized protein n=1 Tax=Hibiscus sabdariffa TaxID=183260 RepID=A0ABR2CSX0_9ROSI
MLGTGDAACVSSLLLEFMATISPNRSHPSHHVYCDHNIRVTVDSMAARACVGFNSCSRQHWSSWVQSQDGLLSDISSLILASMDGDAWPIPSHICRKNAW